MKVALGCDHGGYDLMKSIKKLLEEENIEYIDTGCDGSKPVDYPDYAKKVADLVLSKQVDKGILICGTGIGISIAANKIPGIRCALLSDCYSAQMTRQHNDTNIMALGGRVIGPDLARKITQTFLNTEFSNREKHINRIKKFQPDYQSNE